MPDHGLSKEVAVQKICKDEKNVRSVLDAIWQEPSKTQEVLIEAQNRNQSIFESENTLLK